MTMDFLLYLISLTFLLHGKAITLKFFLHLGYVTRQLLTFSGLLRILKEPLKQTDTTRFARFRFGLKPFRIFTPQIIEHIQFARIGVEQVAVHGTPCTIKRTNDPSGGNISKVRDQTTSWETTNEQGTYA